MTRAALLAVLLAGCSAITDGSSETMDDGEVAENPLSDLGDGDDSPGDSDVDVPATGSGGAAGSIAPAGDGDGIQGQGDGDGDSEPQGDGDGDGEPQGDGDGDVGDGDAGDGDGDSEPKGDGCGTLTCGDLDGHDVCGSDTGSGHTPPACFAGTCPAVLPGGACHDVSTGGSLCILECEQPPIEGDYGQPCEGPSDCIDHPGESLGFCYFGECFNQNAYNWADHGDYCGPRATNTLCKEPLACIEDYCARP